MRGETSVKISTQIVGNYLVKGKWNTAAAICTQALKSNPQDFDLNLLLAKSLTAGNNFTEAISIYKQLIDRQPERANLYAEIGLLYSKNNQINKAIESYHQALLIKIQFSSTLASARKLARSDRYLSENSVDRSLLHQSLF
jgi:tetratricopeptide (TPR) repeat protein